MIETGITFGEIHSYYDLDLILSKVEIPPAQAKTTYIDVPGADGSLDLSEAHGEIKYSDRECKFTFSMLPNASTNWEEKKTEVCNAINGKVFKITLDKDDEYYYSGRCTVNEFLSDKNKKQIVITAKVNPYKFKQDITVFKVDLSGSPKAINIMNARKSVVPSIECSNNNTVITFDNATYNLSAGIHKVLDILFVEGNNLVTVSGSGNVVFSFQEGDL